MGRKKKLADPGIIAFGRAAKAKRLAMGILQKTLASKVGISAPYLSQLESGDVKRPDNEILRKLSGFLALDVAAFIARDERVIPKPISESSGSPQGKYERRTQPELREVFHIVEQMLARQNTKIRADLKMALNQLLSVKRNSAKRRHS